MTLPLPAYEDFFRVTEIKKGAPLRTPKEVEDRCSSILPYSEEKAVEENKKPESFDPGLNGGKADKIVPGNPILSAPPNLHKGEMMNRGFIQINRELFEHPTLQTCPLIYLRLLNILISRVCFAPCTHDDHGVIIELQPGEWCTTLREFALLGKTTKKIVEKFISRLSSGQIGGQRRGHRKSVLSISSKYILFGEGTRKETKRGQEGDKKGTQNNKANKANKKNTHYRSYSPSACELFDFFIDSLKKHRPEVTRFPSTDQTKHFETLLKSHSADTIRSVITYAHQDTAFWRDKISAPLNLVKGTKDHPDRMALLLGRMARDQLATSKTPSGIDRRTKNIDGTPVTSPHDGRW